MKSNICEKLRVCIKPSRVAGLIIAAMLVLHPIQSAHADIPEAPDLGLNTIAAKKFTKTITELVKGIGYLGGEPPKLIAIVPTGEVEKDGQIHYKLKFVYRRVSRDRGDRKFPILEAKNYVSAYTHLLGINPSVAKTVAQFFPKAIFGGRKFPTLFCEVDYLLYHKAEQDSLFLYNYKPKRRPHPKFKKRLIVEELGTPLVPGSYQLRIRADAELDSSHPWVQFYNLVNWVLWAKAPIEISLTSVTGTPDDLIINTSKEVVSSSLLETELIDNFSVLAKVPEVVGKNRAVAQRELEKRSLAVAFQSVFNPNPKLAGKVKSVSPEEGSWLAAGTTVTLTHYALSGGPVAPTPTPTKSDSYAAWIRPDRITCCTSPEGVLTYAYQAGFQSSMPANGILLQGGFASDAALKAWVCNRPVYYHYWATNWAMINGYVVSQLPCDINS